MNRKWVTIALWMAVGTVMAAPKAPGTRPAAQTLTAGRYTATVAALPCGGCGPVVEETLKKNPALEDVVVDAATRTVTFAVKKGASVKLDDVQKPLAAAADAMGMGADYHLKGLKKK
jgi:hypothetical protein